MSLCRCLADKHLFGDLAVAHAAGKQLQWFVFAFSEVGWEEHLVVVGFDSVRFANSSIRRLVTDGASRALPWAMIRTASASSLADVSLSKKPLAPARMPRRRIHRGRMW